MPESPFSLAAAPAPGSDGLAATLPRRPHSCDDAVVRAQGSRRRKLWELQPKCHCPLIGVCFALADLRTLMARVMNFPRETTDFALHTTAVGACETRTGLSAVLQKELEKRYQQRIREFSTAKESAGLRTLWRDCCQTGSDIPGALWASWTHSACDRALEQEIYCDIHMIQHQVGSGTRADLSTLRARTAENRSLRAQLAKLRAEADAQRSERSQAVRLFGERIALLRADLSGKDALLATVTGELDALRESLPDLRKRQLLARRASDAEARATALRARTVELEAEVGRLRRLAGQAQETIARLVAGAGQPGDEVEVLAGSLQPTLEGKRVLCVGGRSGSVDAYRRVVEQRGGNFAHHDGGLEESLHRIDAALGAADLVICQAACISHNAYWRVKEQCKRTGKQCVFIKSAGVTSFDRVVGSAGSGAGEETLD